MAIRRSQMLKAIALASCALGAIDAAHAQDATPATAPAAPAEQAAPQTLPADAPAADADASKTPGDIVVTGTRLTSGFRTPTPVTTEGQEQIAQRAPTTVADVVNQLPAFRQTVGNTQASNRNGGLGQQNVDLRGLGVQRTLLLVDGQRFVPTNLNGTVDLNLIPTVAIDRVEVVTGGASAAYGSDAVSGVVNFILKDRFEGVKATAQYGMSEYGDNIEPAASLMVGKSFMDGRLHVMVAGEYSDNQGTGTIYNRDWTQEAGIISFGAGRPAGTPAQGYLPDVTYATQAAGGLIVSGPLKGIAFGPGGVPYQFPYGTVYTTFMQGGGNANSPRGAPTGNFKLSSAHKRYNVMTKDSFDVSDDTSVYFGFNWARQEQRGISAFHQETNYIVPISNPFIPDSIRAAMIANDLTSITVGRYETDMGGFKTYTPDDTFRETGGIKGKLGGDWKWDVNVEHGVSHSVIDDVNNIIEANYLEAAYVVSDPVTGAPVCGPIATNPNLTAARAAQVQPGCVPFNIFGPHQSSQAAQDYVSHSSINTFRYEQMVEEANISGSPFSTWAGPVSVAAGIAHRWEKGTARGDALGLMGAYYFQNGANYGGSVNVTEGYVEVGVPLLRHKPWAEALDLNGAFRETSYSTSGAVSTYKVGLTWQPNSDLRFRGTYSRDIRAPSILELYQAPTQAFQANFSNPIDGTVGKANVYSAGNPNLTPEIANSYTIGAIFTPHFIRGLRASVDYYNIKLKDVIVTTAASDIVNRCAQHIQVYCDLVSHDPNLGLVINSSAQNLDELKTDGLDIEFDYDVPLSGIGLPGRFDLRWLTTWVNHLTTVDGPVTVERSGSGANGGVPKWTSNMNLTYGVGPSLTNVQLRYTSPILGDATLVGPGQDGYDPTKPNSININKFPAAFYVDLTETYNITKKIQVFGSITNLFDRDPPFAAVVAFLNGGQVYDLIGRSFKIGARLNF